MCSNAEEADSDRRFALEVQHAELRDHVARLAAAHQGDEEGDDIDDMTYEQLTALGDTIGSVKVCQALNLDYVCLIFCKFLVWTCCMHVHTGGRQ